MKEQVLKKKNDSLFKDSAEEYIFKNIKELNE